MEAEKFTFGPESGRVEATVSELELIFVITEIQKIKMDAKLQGQMKKHQIYFKMHVRVLTVYLIGSSFRDLLSLVSCFRSTVILLLKSFL